MSEYDIICNLLRIAPLVIIQALLLLLRRRAFYIRYPLVLLIGWLVIGASTVMYWDYAHEHAPTEELRMEIGRKDGAPRIFGVVFGWVFALFFMVISEGIRFGVQRLLLKRRGANPDDLANLESFLKQLSDVSHSIVRKWHDQVLTGLATFWLAGILFVNVALIQHGFKTLLIPLLAISGIGAVSGVALCLRRRWAKVSALAFSTSYMLVGLFLGVRRIWFIAAHVSLDASYGTGSSLGMLAYYWVFEQASFTLPAIIVTIFLLIKWRRHCRFQRPKKHLTTCSTDRRDAPRGQ